MRPSKPASVLLSLVLALLVLSFSISVPILFRPFYYVQIDALHLPEQTGWSAEAIREAYDEVLDFCVFGAPFGTGELAWSESGRSHFADVRGLFLLDFAVLGVTAAAAAGFLLLYKARGLRFHRFAGRGPAFWAGTGAAAAVLVVAGLAALDFDRAFVVFHSLFFPGKTNWLFDWRADPIILLLPEVFFRNCAILILALLVFWCAVLIAADLLAGRRSAPLSPGGGA